MYCRKQQVSLRLRQPTMGKSYLILLVYLNSAPPDEFRDLWAAFVENEAKIMALFPKGVMVDNIFDFENHAESIVGYELAEFTSYLVRRYSLRSSKHTFKSFDAIKKALRAWFQFELAGGEPPSPGALDASGMTEGN